ncbi:MAG: DUF3575 domain-containing protein, partial [Candidatus Micrarchaeota archaeon]|nr:DUF3575 domain-containing protein [Candidatus Micrarchaeota archaeon]
MSILSILKAELKDSLKVNKVIIATSVFDYLPSLNWNTGNFNIGAEMYVGKNKSLSLNIGIIQSYGPSNELLSITSLSTHGWSVQSEIRYYFNKHQIVQPLILLFWPHIFQFNSKILKNTGYYFSVHTGYQFTNPLRQE